MVQLIVAMDENNGIGNKGNIPWSCKEDMLFFREQTQGNILVMGSKTVENLPKLKDRTIFCLTRSKDRFSHTEKFGNNDFNVINSVEFVNDLEHMDRKVFIAGGMEVYKSALEIPGLVDTIHLSLIKGKYECDTYFDRGLLRDYVISEYTVYDSFTHYLLKYNPNHPEKQYIGLMKKILDEGVRREGRNGETKSLFCENMKFDLREGYPLLTTKKMFLRGIIEELLFFIRGETDSSILSEKKVRIWEGNTTAEFIANKGLKYAEGVMGPMYGYQWRSMNAPYKVNNTGRPEKPDGGVDQLANVIQLIKYDPTSRRILLTTYNPSQAEEGVLYPCHSIVSQFYVDGEFLDMFCYNRSQDFFLGNPYNIASSSLLQIMIAKITGKTPRYFHLSVGDTHLYSAHEDAAKEQISRIPYEFPKIRINKELKSIDDIEKLEYEDFVLEGYMSHPTIKAPMIA